jgi:hypothetical protein
MNGLGRVLIRLDELDKARAMIKSAMDIRVATLGPEHADTSRSYRSWALLLDATGDTAGAREYLVKALAVSKSTLRSRHPLTTLSAWDLFVILERLRDPAADQVFQDHLAWLAEHTAADLHIKQRQIRQKVLAHLAR